MLQDKIINMALGSADPLISADRSRCVRMRFYKNTCSLCTTSCRNGAISIDGGIAIDARKCTECMLCVSECPSGCFFSAGVDFFDLLSKLRKAQNSVPRSVLGCKQARDMAAHEKTSCLGFLSEEHLIALMQYLDKPLFLNLTACGPCRNSFIVKKLKERIQSARTKTFFDIDKRILLAEKKEDLIFEEVSLDRRGFFQALKTLGFTQVAGLIEKIDAEISLSYTAKKLPLKRNILNAVVEKMADSIAVADLLRNYAFTIKTASCNNCFACIGMCPTGALKIKKNAEGPGLLFNSSLCIGCGLCRDFCRRAAITILKGYTGAHYFEYELCSPAASLSHERASRGAGAGIETNAYQGR